MGGTLSEEEKRMARDLDMAAAAAAKEVATVDKMWERMKLDGTPLPHVTLNYSNGPPGNETAVRNGRAAIRAKAVQNIHDTQRMVAESLRKMRELGLTDPRAQEQKGGTPPPTSDCN